MIFFLVPLDFEISWQQSNNPINLNWVRFHPYKNLCLSTIFQIITFAPSVPNTAHSHFPYLSNGDVACAAFVPMIIALNANMIATSDLGGIYLISQRTMK